MKKPPFVVLLVMLLASSYAFADQFMWYTLKDGGFESSTTYYIDVYANTDAASDPLQFALGDTFVTLTYNAAVLSAPLLSDVNTALQSSYSVGLDSAGLGDGFIQLQISASGTPDFMITASEVWLARISFAIDPTAACGGETAGISWSANPFLFKSGDAAIYKTGSDDSVLASSPTIDGTPTVSIATGNAYSFTPTGVGGCGTLAFTIVNQPSWTGFDTDTGELSGSPALADVGTTSGVVIRVTDQNGSWDELTPFDIEVTASCTAPVISGTPGALVTAGNTYSFTPTASNGCGVLTYSIAKPPSWTGFDTHTGKLNGSPTLADVGTTSGVVIRVTDQNGSWDELTPFDIEVTASCTAPVISGTPEALVTAGNTYSFTPIVNNGCGVLTFSIVNQPSWASFDPVTGGLSGTPATLDAADYSGIEITVTDELNAVSTLAAFDIQVSDSTSSSSGSAGGGGGGGGGCFISSLQ